MPDAFTTAGNIYPLIAHRYHPSPERAKRHQYQLAPTLSKRLVSRKSATDQAISACGGNARNAVKALLVTNEFLEAQIAELQAAVSNGYAHGRRWRNSVSASSASR